MVNNKIDVYVPVKKVDELDEPKYPGGPPKGFRKVSNVPNLGIQIINGHKSYIGPIISNENEEFAVNNSEIDCLQISFILNEENWDEIISKSRKQINHILDCISFQIFDALKIIEFQLMNIPSKVSIGVEVETINIINPQSLIQPFYYQSNSLQFLNVKSSEQKFVFERLLDRKQQRIIWWFQKSISSSNLIDRISAILIVLDNLCQPYKVGAYKSSCDHFIEKCPICKASTKRALIGDTVKEYLINVGFNEMEAKEIWEIRQIVHGSDYFSFESMFECDILIRKLTLILYNEIRELLGDKIIYFNTPKFNSASAMVNEGKRALSESDFKLIQLLI